MCLVACALNQHPKYPFILIANRDEFRERPSAPAHFWKEHPNILAGIDLKMNGTWLGITRTGRVALITNYRDLNNLKSDAPSRGELVSNFLKSEVSADDYLNSITDPTSYNGFNLLVGDKKGLSWFSNESEEPAKLESGIFGLSNALLDTPWPKVDALKNGLNEVINSNSVESEKLFALLASSKRPADTTLPDTGVGLELERLLSSAFINSEKYGTVCSTVILIDQEDNVQFFECSFDGNGTVSGEVSLRFPLKA